MHWFVWFLIINFSLMTIGIIVSGIVIAVRLKSRVNVRAIIILKAGGQKGLWVNRKTQLTFEYDKNTYNFTEQEIIKTRFKDFIYYLEGIPDAIHYDFKTFKPTIPSNELNTVLNDNLLKKLFTNEDIERLTLLVIILLVISGLTLILLAFNTFGSHGVQIKDSPENHALLINITRSVLTGAI